MDKVFFSIDSIICCLKCDWEGQISDLKQERSEMLEETVYHSCPECDTPLIMETETQAHLSKVASITETIH